MTLPDTHYTENQRLEAEAYVDLFELHLNPTGVVLFKNNEPITWDGKYYEGFALSLSGVDMNADEEESRPTFTVVNPKGFFTSFVAQGNLEKATIIRRRVLRSNIVSNTVIAQVRYWLVSRVALVTYDLITLELRDLTDGPNFLTPARLFIPPEFRTVSLR